MLNINVLTEGFNSPNGIAFISPLVIFQKYIHQNGIQIRFFTSLEKQLEKCEILLIESKFFKTKWENNTSEILELFKKWREKKIKLIFCDTTDSSSWVKSEVFDFVDKYAKGQILKNKTQYLKPIYASRVYADFYHKKFKVNDLVPNYSNKLREDHLSKLYLSWNSGLSNYSLFGPLINKFLNFNTAKYLCKFSNSFVSPSANRTIINCRFSNNYNSKSIRYQRSVLKKKLSSFISIKKLNRFKYVAEMKKSLISIVPFGYGEITLKDYESFINGNILLKPNMDHMSTWPNFYIKNKTFIEFPWDFKNIKINIESIKKNSYKFIKIANGGQEIYKKYTVGENSNKLFYEQFINLVK